MQKQTVQEYNQTFCNELKRVFDQTITPLLREASKTNRDVQSRIGLLETWKEKLLQFITIQPKKIEVAELLRCVKAQEPATTIATTTTTTTTITEITSFMDKPLSDIKSEIIKKTDSGKLSTDTTPAVVTSFRFLNSASTSSETHTIFNFFDSSNHQPSYTATTAASASTLIPHQNKGTNPSKQLDQKEEVEQQQSINDWLVSLNEMANGNNPELPEMWEYFQEIYPELVELTTDEPRSIKQSILLLLEITASPIKTSQAAKKSSNAHDCKTGFDNFRM